MFELDMSLPEKLRPKFWNYIPRDVSVSKDQFNFRRIWNLAVLLTAGVALVPLTTMTVIHYQVTQNAIESEINNHTYRLVVNTWGTVSYFLDERRTVLDLIAQDTTFEELNDPARLSAILKNLKRRLGGLVDLGVVNSSGRQTAYVGPYKLTNVDYSDQKWFKKVMERGVYTSDLFLGFRNIPHIVIAGKYHLTGSSFYVLRATLDIDTVNNALYRLELSGFGDAFIINKEGMLQTPSRYHGKALNKISLSVPVYSSKAQVVNDKDPKGEPLIVGYAYIPDTPFILMIVQKKDELMKPWYKIRMELIWFLVISITVILLVTLGVVTYLVNRIYVADQERAMSLHHMEYSNRLASIGRLAAGVAHEINNPLAIINEKAGLIKDMFTYKEMYSEDKKLIGLVDSIISSVDRCGTITKRLLGFARHMDVSIQPVNLREVIHEVLGFLEKEAEYRSITVSVDVPDDIPQFESDRGKLQQIFLNLVNNAFAAMKEGGRLDINVRRKDEDSISATVSDTGCGILEADINRIFEPFFSTKTKKGGTGLGLSITCGLVQEIGGDIDVHSEVGKGTSFIITLPLKPKKKRE
jgi:two-component system NtrC family sensor kinase